MTRREERKREAANQPSAPPLLSKDTIAGEDETTVRGRTLSCGVKVPPSDRTFVLHSANSPRRHHIELDTEEKGEVIRVAELRTRVIREVSTAPDIAPGNHRFEMGTLQTSNLYLCGECGIILAQDVPSSEPHDSTIRCPNCNAVNEFGDWLPWIKGAHLKMCPSCHKRRRHPNQRLCGSCWWK